MLRFMAEIFLVNRLKMKQHITILEKFLFFMDMTKKPLDFLIMHI